jgi:hypothetical protein
MTGQLEDRNGRQLQPSLRADLPPTNVTVAPAFHWPHDIFSINLVECSGPGQSKAPLSQQATTDRLVTSPVCTISVAAKRTGCFESRRENER